jgi:hypothetical protein
MAVTVVESTKHTHTAHGANAIPTWQLRRGRKRKKDTQEEKMHQTPNFAPAPLAFDSPQHWYKRKTPKEA